jgi:nucleoside-diphosphate-sugar epimerase
MGEYAMSCLGRERMFEYFSRTLKIPVTLLRLNYACELRYGVLVDLAQQVWQGAVIDLAMGYLNALWQADANAMTLCAFRDVKNPPFILNLTGPELLRVREVCEEFGRLLNKPVHFKGQEAPNALLNNAATSFQLYGAPRVTAQDMIPRIADWIRRGGPTLGKPTHFESRDGKF